jgi:hypothetical protein
MSDFVNEYGEWMSTRYVTIPGIQKHLDLDRYLDNNDHGIRHSANIRLICGKIQEDYLTLNERNSIDPSLLDALSLFHDIARFAKSDTPHRVTKFRTHHQLTGAAIMRIMCKDDKNFGHLISPMNHSNERIILSHDYHSPKLTPDDPKPNSLVSSLFALADKTSVNPVHEALRRVEFLTTRPNDAVPIFDPNMTDEERWNWTFNDKARDALCAILPMFTYNPRLFTDNAGLIRYYTDWSSGLSSVKDAVLQIVMDTGYSINLQENISNCIDTFTIA